MTAKEVIFRDDARAKIVRGIDRATDAVVAELREATPPAHTPAGDMEM